MKDSILVKSGIPLIILIVAIVAAAIMISSRKPPESFPVETQAFLVEANAVNSQSVNFVVNSQGNVVPKNKTAFSAQVSGRVVSLADNFVVGGMFQQGDVLAVLEQADYITEVQLAEAELAQAIAALEEEVARGKVAEQEWRSVNSIAPPELGLRKPQLAKEQANVKAAEAKLERAKRNLARTEIRAPYNGIVVERNIDLGQFVSVGASVAMLYSTDVAEVRLPITDNDLVYVDVNSSSAKPTVSLRATVGGITQFWQGTLARTEGVLDASSRVVYAVVEVLNPYNQSATGQSPLRFGQFVQAEITASESHNLTVLPRSLLRFDNTILTVNGEREIAIKPVEVVRTTTEDVFISAGLDANDLVISSPVPNPYNGMKVRLPGDEPELPPEAQNDVADDTESVSVTDDSASGDE